MSDRPEKIKVEVEAGGREIEIEIDPETGEMTLQKEDDEEEADSELSSDDDPAFRPGKKRGRMRLGLLLGGVAGAAAGAAIVRQLVGRPATGAQTHQDGPEGGSGDLLGIAAARWREATAEGRAAAQQTERQKLARYRELTEDRP